MAINTTSTSSAEVRMTVSGAITAGDLLVNTEGVATKSSTLLSMAQINNTTAGLSVILPVTSQGANYGDSGSAYKRFCENPNGEILTVVTGNGTTSSTGVRLSTVNLLGATVSPDVTVTSAVSCIGVRIKRLTSTTVVIAWTESSVLKFAVYNNNATLAVAAVTVSTLSNFNAILWNMSVLTSTDIIFAYSKVTSTNCNFTRYNAAGVLQGAETTVEASAAPQGICVQTQAAGGFVVYYYRSAATVAFKFARYNAAGVLQGALTTVSTGASVATTGEYDYMALELTNGNLIFQWNSSATSLTYSVYDSSGNFIVSTPTITNGSGPIVHGLAVTPSGGFVTLLSISGSTAAVFRTFTSAGLVIATSSPVVNGTAATGTGTTLIIVPGPQNYVVFSQTYDGTTNYFPTLTNLSQSGVVVGSSVGLLTGTVNTTSISMVRHTSGSAVFGGQVSPTLYLAIYNPNRASIIGVALETVADGATCRVSTRGTYPLNQTLLQGGPFDQRTAAVPGTRGFVVGSTAVLLGLA